MKQQAHGKAVDHHKPPRTPSRNRKQELQGSKHSSNDEKDKGLETLG